MTTRNRLALAAWLSLAATLYITLLPFQWLPIAWADAWEGYWQLTFRSPSPGDRQQMMANALAFMPLGFFWTGWLVQYSRHPLWQATVAVFVAALALFTTGSVEFLQSWLPHRVPALLDISANFAGGLVGIAAWFLFGEHLRAWLTRIGLGGKMAVRRLLFAYVALYLLASLMPLDFVLSWEEWLGRLESDLTSWWIAPAGCENFWRCTVLRLAEVGLTIPLGIWLAVILAQRSWSAWVLAPALGIAVEGAQLLTVNGVVEGLSAAARASGALLGVLAVHYRRPLMAFPLEAAARPLVVLAVIPYILLLLAIHLGSQGFILETGPVREKWEAVRWLPFYHHYFVPETRAMASVTFVLIMFAPVGVLAWLWTVPARRATKQNRGLVVIAMAVLLAFLMESGKLFMSELRFDVTNLLLAGFAAWGTWRVCYWAWAQWTTTDANNARKPAPRDPPAVSVAPTLNVSSQPAGMVAPPAGKSSAARGLPGNGGTVTPSRSQGIHSWPYLFAGLILSGAVVFAAVQHPIAPAIALFAVVLYAAILWRWPAFWLVAVPAALPVLDFRPWTGQLFFDEWDLLVLSTLAVLSLRAGLVANGRTPTRASLMPTGRLWLLLFLVSYGAAIAFALWPPAWPQFLDFSNLHSPYNALRLAKGVLWALLLWHFLVRTKTGGRPVFEWLTLGMMLGLLGTGITVLWERFLFPGLFNFSTDYRVVGMFSDTHTGGAFLEAYLVTAVPFLLMALAWRPRVWWHVLAAVLFLLATYAVAVTFARAGYAGLLVAVVVTAAAVTAVAAGLRFGVALRARALALLGMLLVLAAGFTLLDYVKQDEFMSQRVDAERIQADWDTRMDHWRQALEPVFANNWSAWRGLGVGRFPAVHSWESMLQGRSRVASYTMNAGPDGVTLVLTPGRSLFFWQAVPVEPQSEYRVTVVAEGGRKGHRLGVYLCEKWVLYSRRCTTRGLQFDAGADLQARETVLRAPAQLTSHSIFERPSKLILYNASGGASITIASVSMVDPWGRELLANNDFSEGMDRWFFTSDDHLAWHVKNLWAQVFFEQGWIGVALWTLLVFTALWGANRKALSFGAGARSGAVLLASLLSFLTVGMFDSLFDAPRLATLFFLLLMLALVSKSDWRMLTEAESPRRARVQPHG